ncbi:sensor histidine kinase [Pelagicoccus sp. SDUM812002]|uniref:sensor histidine kinase n=1 Tax=Pelagicoccus sp. SDUM812002 TaxID=3041266 RepID=UPI00280EB845|nr:sensor histidine kinase [Pelagicoccus sp. SDUM812002]MDQ8184341.1 sensor histidine kinase [Pelagicoccus sp. SDUM812002]
MPKLHLTSVLSAIAGPLLAQGSPRIVKPFLAVSLALFTSYFPAFGSSPSIGLPITRTYSIEEIGASRGPQLNFDQLGRLAVISSGSYIVLNDDNWIDLAVHSSNILPVIDLIVDHDGNAYYGALASWGVAKTTEDGRILPTSLRPAEYPAWINSTNFTQILPTPTGILFVGTNGVVHLQKSTGEQNFIETPVATAFRLGDEIFLSSGQTGTVRLDPLTGNTETIDAQVAVFETAEFGDGGIVAATSNNRLLYFDGHTFTESYFGFEEGSVGPISCLEALPDGGFAIAIDSVGLFLVDGSGQRKMALTSTNYRRILDLAVHDAGILWLARESSVEKLLYNNPVSVVDQRAEVVIGWPQVLQWGGDSLIASNGRLYKMVLANNSWNYRFEELPESPPFGVWAIAANEEHLLVGNGNGVYASTRESFTPILENFEANRLFLQEKNLCIVVGSREITALRWDGEQWSEFVPRIPGVGFPSVAHVTEQALWIELGLDRVARVWFENGELQLQVIDEFPWDEPVWVNIGVLNDYIMLSGAYNQRIYLDKDTALPSPAPEIDEALSRSPVTILRASEDENGMIWASHPEGVITIRPSDDGYTIDTESLDSIRDQYPVITLFNGQHAWISTESALYHVDQDFTPSQNAERQPFLVSIVDGKTGLELYTAAKPNKVMDTLPYSKNHLVFRYFSDGYKSLDKPIYEFSMQKGSDSWKVQSEDSLLTLPSLEEGSYQLSAQLTEAGIPVGDPVVTNFKIEPPWYRANAAYFLYWSAGILICLSVMSSGMHRAKRKHDELEELVRQRTDELRDTMQKLTDEARTSATLAERNRLAGEIHDSLQQGLSGIALQLDATLKHDNLDTNLHNRLSVARRMVSFTRQEVQQAVWDLESPLLQDESLSEALRNITQVLGAGSAKLKVQTSGTPTEIPSRRKHHILRIAQEAITNAVRHSQAENITIALHFTEDQLRLEIHDDGQGFDPSEVFSEGLGHFGLRGLRTRASKIDGLLTIDSIPQKGTSVTLNVPISKDDQ